MNCYIVFAQRSQAFLIERRLKDSGINCSISYVPREITSSLCNMCVRFDIKDLNQVNSVMNHAGIWGYKMFKEYLQPNRSYFEEISGTVL